MRTFVAVELPDAERRGLAVRLNRARRAVTRKARWVPSDNLHVTLVFLGQLAADAADRLRAELRVVCAVASPFACRLTPAGCFPAGGRARVLWTGVESDGVLEALQDGIARALVKFRLAPVEERPFHAHVTWARLDPPWPAAEAQRVLELVDRDDGESGAPPQAAAAKFPVEEVVLFESRLGAGGSVYVPIERFPLGDRGAP